MRSRLEVRRGIPVAGLFALAFGVPALPASMTLSDHNAGIRPSDSAWISLPDRTAYRAINDLPLQQALVEPQAKSGVPIAFSSALLPRDRRVQCARGTRTVRETPGHLLRATDSSYAKDAKCARNYRQATAREAQTR